MAGQDIAPNKSGLMSVYHESLSTSSVQHKKPWLSDLLLGFIPGIAQGATTVVLGHPLDTAKTRMQAVGPNVRSSVFQTVLTIARQESIWGLYRGAGPPILMEGAKRGIQFALWDIFRSHSSHSSSSEGIVAPVDAASRHSVLSFIGSSTFVSGAVAGGLGTLLGCPMHVIKIQTQNQTSGGTKNAWTCTQDIWRREGFRGFYRGFTANLIKDVFFAGSYLSLYTHLKAYFHSQLCDSGAISSAEMRAVSPSTRGHPYEALETFLSGSFACVLTWVLLYPLDTVKTLVQSRSVSSLKALRPSQMHFRDVYRGLSASLWRAGPIAGAAMIVYESIRGQLSSSTV